MTAREAPAGLDEDARRRLASLGYIGATAAPVVRRDAPRPADMTRLIRRDRQGVRVCSCRNSTPAAIPLFEQILAGDREQSRRDAAARRSSHSLLGHEPAAMDAFRRAARLAPESADVRTYLGLHYARDATGSSRRRRCSNRWSPRRPQRLARSKALAAVRERQGRTAEAVALYQQASALRPMTAAGAGSSRRAGHEPQQTPTAIAAFEKARAIERRSLPPRPRARRALPLGPRARQGA